VNTLGRMATERLLELVGAVVLVGCSPLPQADSYGRRVRVGSDVVEQICGGTLTRLDAEIDTIEDRLGLAHDRDRVSVFVVSDPVFDQYCRAEAHGCYHGPADRVILGGDTFEPSITHELTHAVAWRQPAGWAPIFFAEGLATALARPRCPSPDSDALQSIDEMLASDIDYEGSGQRNNAAGRLVAWLLDAHGPFEVLEFMGALHRGQHPDSIRKVYLEHFGTWLDEDLVAHLQDEPPLTAAEAGYLATVAGPTHDIARFALSATLNCDSPRVHNDFEQPELGWVEWTIVIADPSHGGRYSVIGEIPKGTTLEYQWASCWDPELPNGGWLELGAEQVAYLHPERVQRIRWSGPLGSAALNVELQGPCDPRRQNCPSGLVCSEGGDCRPLLDVPAGLGESCEEGLYVGPLACARGLVCIGDPIVDGSPEGSCLTGCAWDSTHCPSGSICDPEWEFCAPTCDPLAQDCNPGHTCYPSEGTGICVPSENVGVWQSCKMSTNWSSGFACAPGLVCTRFPQCPSEDHTQGCCVPVCDPRLDEPSCPPDLPRCSGLSFSEWGSCTP
jgi:hypothetical protein